MLTRLLRADLARHAVVSVILTALIALACALVAGSTRMIVDTTTANARLASSARLPDLVQMHSGAADPQDISAWAANHPDVVDHEVIESLPAPRSQTWINGVNQGDSYQEPAFVTAPQRLDLLLDETGEPYRPEPGQIALPIHYSVTGAAHVGDTVEVRDGDWTMSLTVIGFFRDAQMNPAMVPSKRLVVNPADFAALSQHITTPEYFIELDLADGARPGTVAGEYKAAGLPAQGINVDGSMIQLMSALSTQLIAAVAILVALTLAGVAVLALRYTILAALEADLAQIAVLKAVGLPQRRIARLYHGKYMALTLAGALVGLVAGAPLGGLLEGPALEYLGTAPVSVWSLGLPLVAVGVMAGGICLMTRLVLRRTGRVSAVEALRSGTSGSLRPRRHRWRLTGSRRTAATTWMGVREALRPANALLVGVLALCTVTMVMPLNVASTLDNPQIATYLGVGRADLRIDVRNAADLPAVAQALSSDERVSTSTTVLRRDYEMRTSSGKWESLLVDIGDHDAFPMEYLQGRTPADDGEISLSYNQAQAVGAGVGDTVTVRSPQGQRTVKVTGIYQDITNNGLTAKATFDDATASLWQLAYADVATGQDAAAVAQDLRATLPDVQVTAMSQYASQFFGATAGQVRTVAIMSCAVAAGLAFLITALFGALVLARDRQSIGVLLALGATRRAVRRQYLVRFGVIAATGVVLGLAATLALGPAAIGAVMSSRGAPSITLLPQWWLVGLVVPAALLATTTTAIVLALRRLPTGPLRSAE